MSTIHIDITCEKQKEFLTKILLQAGHTCTDHPSEADVTLYGADLALPIYMPSFLKTLSSQKMTLQCSSLTLDRRHRRLIHGESSAQLTEKETEALAHLMRLHPQPAHRDDLLRQVWGYNPDVMETHTLETLIYRLRQKLSTLDGVAIAVDDGFYSLEIKDDD